MKYNNPWEYYIIDDFLPEHIYENIKQIEIASNNLNCEGTRGNVTGRYFITPDKKDHLTSQVVDYFKSNTKQFEQQFGYSLAHSYLRAEIVQDTQDFWQECHLDTLEKRITMLIYIGRDDSTVNLGTDLYKEQDGEFSVRAEWKDNRALVFKPTETTWHGFNKRAYEGNRRVLIINYVDKDQWNSIDQVWDMDE